MGQAQNAHRTGRFDALRLIFASFVFVFHLVVLPHKAPQNIQNILAHFAQLSIEGFFIISGALVYGSWLRCKDYIRYAIKRVRRLYPAYVIVILIPAMISFGLGGAATEVGKYVLANLAFLNFLHPTLPGIFNGLPHPQVNGALWTLKIEVMFYITLPVLAWALVKAGRLKWGLIIAIYIGAEIWRTYFQNSDMVYGPQLARQLPGQMAFFITGMVLWELRPALMRKTLVVFIAGSLLFALSFIPALFMLKPAGLGCLIFALAYAPGPKMDLARYGDLSYGIYITHFPIINSLIALGLFSTHLWLGYMVSTLFVVLTSFLMWHLVEKRFLIRKRQVGNTGR